MTLVLISVRHAIKTILTHKNVLHVMMEDFYTITSAYLTVNL